MYSNCNLCPRECGANRTEGAKGICGQSNEIKIARAALHMWEEPCISGEEGSGTIFFTGCNLHCVFCQNSRIANGDNGHVVSVEELADEMLKLQKIGANNINLVTGGHFIPSIKAAIDLAKEKGLSVPIVYNTSSYETCEQIKSLEGYVDIYLPDLKYVSTALSEKYSHAKDYFEVASAAIKEMVRQVGKPEFDENDMMTKGVIVRHLVLPGCVFDSKAVIEFLLKEFGDDVFISIMNQYTPLDQVKDAYPELYRKITDDEYEEVLDYAIDLGIENGFFQEGDVASESFIPDFE